MSERFVSEDAEPGQGQAKLKQEGVDAHARAEGAQDRFDSDLRFLSAPSRVSVGAREPGGDLSSGGRDLTLSYTQAGEEGSLSASGGISTSPWARVTRADEHTSVRGGATLSKTWIGGNGGIAWATLDGGATSVSGGAAWYPGGIALDANLTRSSKEGGTVGLGAMGFFDADRAVRDLGPAEGESGQRRIELRRSLGASGTLSPGAAAGLLGVGLRIGAGKKRGVVYRTTVSDEDARALVGEKKGVVGWARDKARVTGAADDPVRIPDVRAPETFAVGDELVTTVTGRFKTGLFIGGLPLRLGAQGMVQGEFQLGVRRLDEHRFEVVVTPTDIKGLQGRVGAPWLIEGDLGRAECAALTQGFVFDLREAAAREALDRVFDGELPGGLPNQVKGRRREANELVRALAQESLPAGVQRSFVDQVELVRSHKGVSTSFGLWFKGGSRAGLGLERASVEGTRVRLDGRGTLTTDTRGVERRRQVLLSGEEGRGVYASLKRRTTFDDEGTPARSFEGLKLTLELTDSRLRGQELDDEMIAALNESFGLSLPLSGREGRNQSRDITVTRVLSAEDLERLAELEAPDLSPLQGRLEDASVEERALAVQDFVARGGLEAMGALVRALGSSVVIDTVSSAYDGPLERARELGLRYPEPISVGDDNRTLARRFDEGAKVLREATLGLEDLEHDPLVDEDAREGLREKLELAYTEAALTLSVAHLSAEERRALVEQLERGWVTAKERRVIEALS